MSEKAPLSSDQVTMLSELGTRVLRAVHREDLLDQPAEMNGVRIDPAQDFLLDGKCREAALPSIERWVALEEDSDQHERMTTLLSRGLNHMFPRADAE